MSETTTIHFGINGGYGQAVTVDGEIAAVTPSGKVVLPCGDCDNDGWAGRKQHYLGIDDGVCYRCDGRGFRKAYDSLAEAEKAVTRNAKARARREAKRQAEADAKSAEHAAARAAFVAAHPALAARLTEIIAPVQAHDHYSSEAEFAFAAVVDTYGTFIADIANRVEFTGLSEAQVEAVEKALADHDAKVAAKVQAQAAARHYGEPKQRVTVTGTVKVWSSYVGDYGTVAIVVITGTGDFEGFEFKTSGSGSTLWDVERGDAVEVTGTIKGHGEYDGIAQTILTRVKAKSLASA